MSTGAELGQYFLCKHTIPKKINGEGLEPECQCVA